MLQFSKWPQRVPRLLWSLLTTMSTGYKSMQAKVGSVAIEPISNGSNEAESLGHRDHNRFKAIVSESLAKLIEKLEKSPKYQPKCLVYDSVMPWAIDVAQQYGLAGAAFFTQSCAVKAIYILSCPSRINIKDALRSGANIQEANWIFCNTFDMLDDEVLTWMASQWPVKTIGPTIPSMYLDKRLEDDKEYDLNLFKPDANACMKWLDTKETGCVIYASFGSLAALGEEQMEELAWGLKNSNCYFLWVVRESEEKKLPNNFLKETTGKGLIVSWCPQLEVLAHKAVGCFMTHCGWNSTLEALSLGVPMVAMPQWTDQTTNAKFIVDVWKVGVRTKLDEKGIATTEEIERCIKEVMEGERRKEMKKNSMRWKELAKEAADEGESSDKNIVEFVSKLAHS